MPCSLHFHRYPPEFGTKTRPCTRCMNRRLPSLAIHPAHA